MDNVSTIIVREERNPYTGEWEPILFIPSDAANYGMVSTCSPKEGHGEASLEYYPSTRKPKNWGRKSAEWWANWYANYGGGEPVPVQVRQRMDYDMLRAGWV